MSGPKHPGVNYASKDRVKTSRYVGVGYQKRTGKWCAWVGNIIQLGQFDTEVEAAQARNAGQIKHFGWDPSPNIIEEYKGTKYGSVGNLEDLIRGISHIRDNREGSVYVRGRNGESAASAIGRMAKVFSLLRCQEYIKEACIKMNAAFDVDLDSIAIPKTSLPWLTVPEVKPMAKVVIHRTIGSGTEGWKEVVEKYKDECVYLGTKDDRQLFRAETGAEQLPYHRYADKLLDAAQVIAGCELFIGDNSAYSAIAEGLGVKLVSPKQWLLAREAELHPE